MDNLDRATLLGRLGLSTEAIGPLEEWSPTDPGTYQKRHNAYWRAVSDIMPDDENDEPYWMTEEASAQLRQN